VPPTTTTVPPTTTTVPPTTTTVPPTTTTAPPTTTTQPSPPPPAPATITPVGNLQADTNQPSAAQEQIGVSPAKAGDLLTIAVETKFPGTASFTSSSISGGGVTSWTRAASFLTVDGFHGQELWYGAVTAAGPSTITVGFTAGSTQGSSASATSLGVQEFASSSGAATKWALDVTGKVDTGNASTAPSYPSLTPTSTKEAYFGYLAVTGSVGAGGTPGVVYQTDARGNQNAYAVSVSARITPVAASGSSQLFTSVGMLMKAT